MPRSAPQTQRRRALKQIWYLQSVMSAGSVASTVGALPRLWRLRDVAIVFVIVELAFAGALIFTRATSVRGDGISVPDAFILIGFSVITASAVLLLAAHRSVSADDLGLGRSFTWRPVVVGWLGAYVILFGYVIVVRVLTQLGLPFGSLVEFEYPDVDRGGLALVGLVGFGVVVAAPFSEELLYRGLLHRWLRGYWHLFPAMALSASVFALAHGNLALVLPFAAVGCLWAWLYEQSNSLWPVIVAHAGVNGVGFALHLLFAG